MNQANHTVLIYSMFYERVTLPLRNLNRIVGIDHTEILRFLIKLKVAISRPGIRNVDHPFIRQLIAVLPPVQGTRLYQMLSTPGLGDFLTHPIVINLIIADLLNEPVQITEFVKLPLDALSRFVSAMIDLVLIYNEHHFKTIQVGNRPDDHELLWEMMLMQNINGLTPSAYVRNGIGKQLAFLEFLKYKLGDRFDEFEKQLAELLGIKKLSDVPQLFVNLQIEQDKLDQTTNPLLAVLPENPLYSVFERMGLVIDVRDKSSEQGIESLVMHCFLKLPDGKLYLTGTNDFGLITDLGWRYFLFNKGNLTNFLPKVKNENQQFSLIGTEYIEKFLLVKLCLSLSKVGFRVIPSDDQKIPDVTIVHNETDVFLIEIKSYAIHYNVWKEQNLPLLKKHLDEKYVSEKTGVIQLYKNLRHLAADPAGLFKIHTPLKKLRIYPVIIYTEPQLMSMAVNDYVINHSSVLEESLRNNFYSVLPVTMIHYDFFIENLEVIRGNKKVLKDAVVRYHKDVKARKAAWIKFRSTLNFIRAMISFDAHSAGFENLYRADQKDIRASMMKVFRTDK